MSEITLVSLNDAASLPIDNNEVKRYLKIHKLDTQSNDLIEECKKEIYRVATPRAVYSEECISVSENEIKFCFDLVESKSLSKNLCGCKKAYLMCATLGTEVDRIIKKYAKIEPSKSLVLDSVATTLIESFTDYVNEILKDEKSLCPRFSAGYGDYSILHQKKILERLDASRKIGVTLTDSYMMLPFKTVSAVIGIKE